jgi:hypothetical protein
MLPFKPKHMIKLSILLFAALCSINSIAQIKYVDGTKPIVFYKTSTKLTWQWLEGKWASMGLITNDVLNTEKKFNAAIDSVNTILKIEAVAKDSAKADKIKTAQKLCKMVAFSIKSFQLSFIGKNSFILNFFDTGDVNDDLSVSSEDIETYTGTYKIMPKQKIIMLYTPDEDKPIILNYQVYKDKLQIQSKDLVDGLEMLLQKQ